MSEEDVTRLRALYAEWARGDFRRSDLFAEDWEFAPGSVGDWPALGKEAATKQFREFLSEWRDFRIIAEDFDDLGVTPEGDVVLVTERQYGTGRGSGVAVDATFYAVWTFRNERVTSARWYTDRAKAFEAAGLSE
jgi:ketosteroid isomerase-like protein